MDQITEASVAFLVFLLLSALPLAAAVLAFKAARHNWTLFQRHRSELPLGHLSIEQLQRQPPRKRPRNWPAKEGMPAELAAAYARLASAQADKYRFLGEAGLLLSAAALGVLLPLHFGQPTFVTSTMLILSATGVNLSLRLRQHKAPDWERAANYYRTQ